MSDREIVKLIRKLLTQNKKGAFVEADYDKNEKAISLDFSNISCHKRDKKIIKTKELIKELNSVKNLSLRNSFTGNYEIIEQFKQVERFTFNNRSTPPNPKILNNLPNIKEIYFGSCFSLAKGYIEQLPKLDGLHILNCNNFSVNEISHHHNISKLTLFSNGLTDINWISDLTELKFLNLSRNKISDLSPLITLSNLATLWLTGNPIENLEAIVDFKCLPNLKNLSLNRTGVADLSILKNCHNLEGLFLQGNNIEDLSTLPELNNLEIINLNLNNISNIQALKKLSKLRFIDLAFNPLVELPKWVVDSKLNINWNEFALGEQSCVNLFNNPLVHPPVEIVKQGKEAIIQYFESFKESDTVKLNEVKVLLVGEGMAGKTSLLKRLQGEEFCQKESQTHGINVVTLKGEDIKGAEADKDFENCQLHFWDFGGQEIMHASHQFFMSERALYVLVLDSRTDSKKYYWLKHIEKFGGNSPIILLMNKIDDNANYNVQQKELNRQFPALKNRFFRVSCRSDAGIPEFLAELPKAIRDTSLFNSDISLNWMRVKQDLVLATREANYVDHKRYLEICKSHNVNEKAAQNTLLKYLHDLGVVLHFEQLNLNNIFVLDPHWVTIGVYKIINSGKVAEGVLSVKDLDYILNQETINPDEYDPAKEKSFQYSREEQNYLVSIMELFELCYPLSNDRNQFIIPDLLPKELDIEPELDAEGTLQFIMEYDFLPGAVISRLMLQLHLDIEQGQQWRFGMILHSKEWDCRAKIKVLENQRRIHIWITGERYQKQKYFAVIKHHLNIINNSFKNLEIEELIPLPGHPKELVSYPEILGLEKMGEAFYIHGKLQRKFSVAELLDCYSSKEQRQEDDMINKDIDKVHVNVNISDVGNPTVRQSNEQRGSQQSSQSNSQRNLQRAQLTATQQQSIEMQIGQLKGAFENLKDDILQEADIELEDDKEKKRLKNELDRVSKAMAELEKAHSAGERELSPSTLERFEDFVEDIQDDNSRIGKMLAMLSKGKKKTQSIAAGYNKIAPWFGLPVVPEAFLEV